MARTKQTVPLKPKGPITWTRFRLPPNHEWPAWPCLGATTGATDNATDPPVNPLEGVGGASCYTITLGKLVESPQEAVCMIQWKYMDDVNNFLASPACDAFLKLLGLLDQESPGEEEEDDAGAGAGAGDDKDYRRRHRHFLVLKHWEEAATSTIQGRVTLSTFVVPEQEEDGYAGLYTLYRDLRETFGRYDRPKTPDADMVERFGRAANRSRVWFYSRRPTGQVEQEEMSRTWLGKTFGRGESGDGGGTEEASPKKTALMCEFRVWNDYRDVNVNLSSEEENAKDGEIKELWDRFMGEWMSHGRVLAWKRERWDFEPVLGFRERRSEEKMKEEEASGQQ